MIWAGNHHINFRMLLMKPSIGISIIVNGRKTLCKQTSIKIGWRDNINILLFGSNGQLGQSFCRLFKKNNINFTALSKKNCDVTNNKDLDRVLTSNNYDFIINASAYTNVSDAEINPDIAYEVNDIAIKNIASLIDKDSSVLIHFSTDYVFNGKKKLPYTEEDSTNPINEYGKSKLNGEINLKKSDINYFIFRTSWVYDNKGNNFPNKIVNLARQGKSIEVIDDQFGIPNHVDFISLSTLICLKKYCKYSTNEKNRSHGIYNLSCNDQTTWFNFAKYILDGIYKKSDHQYVIKALKSDNFKSNVKRPQYSVMSNKKIAQQFDIEIPSWQYYADKYIESFYE